MKYFILERSQYKDFVVHVYEVRDKQYLLIRIFKDGHCVHQIFAGYGNWIKIVDKFFERRGA